MDMYGNKQSALGRRRQFAGAAGSVANTKQSTVNAPQAGVMARASEQLADKNYRLYKNDQHWRMALQDQARKAANDAAEMQYRNASLAQQGRIAQMGDSTKRRGQDLGMRESALSRKFRGGQAQMDRDWRSGEGALGRIHDMERDGNAYTNRTSLLGLEHGYDKALQDRDYDNDRGLATQDFMQKMILNQSRPVDPTPEMRVKNSVLGRYHDDDGSFRLDEFEDDRPFLNEQYGGIFGQGAAPVGRRAPVIFRPVQ